VQASTISRLRAIGVRETTEIARFGWVIGISLLRYDAPLSSTLPPNPVERVAILRAIVRHFASVVAVFLSPTAFMKG
jgi:hypothetical protein